MHLSSCLSSIRLAVRRSPSSILRSPNIRPSLSRSLTTSRATSIPFHNIIRLGHIHRNLLIRPYLRFSSTAANTMSSSFVIRRVDNITKSSQDEREYRGLELSNGLKVLLVSDAKTDKSAAAMDVKVGHLMDPWELPGLAHFCEHMLFLGTDKYPSENEYSKFISAHAGSSNAYTSSDHTNYHFDIKPEQLFGGLDRFVQFFLSPQFTESATEREVCAVDSEHLNNLNNDAWRIQEIERSLSKPGHDYGKFGTGNKKTLLEDARVKGIEPRDALLKFHKKWYSSNIMTLCIVGKESLDELEGYLGTLGFDAIENKNVEKMVWPEHPYGKEQLAKRIEIVPIKDSRTLKIAFPITDMRMKYRSYPDHLINHFLGHEGAGSLLSELKRLGWVSNLSAGSYTQADGIANFNITVDLSPEGLERTEDIVAMVFHYIGLLKRDYRQVLPWLQEEIQNLYRIKFTYKDTERPQDMASNISSNLQHYPFEDILSWPYLLDNFDIDLMEEELSQLHPNNMNYRVVSQTFAGNEGNTTEKTYGTEMKVLPIGEATIQRFIDAMNTPHPMLKLAGKNEYVPTNLELKERAAIKSEHPRLISDGLYSRVWFKQDDEFKMPKMVTKISLSLPLVTSDPRSVMLAALFQYCFQDAMAEETYDAHLAGLKFQLGVSYYGPSFKVTGYDQKQPLFAKNLIEKLINFKPDPLRFEVLFESTCRSFINFSKSQPHSLALHNMRILLSEKAWTYEQLLAVCQDITLEEVEKFGREMFKAFHVEIFVHGNATEQEALDLASDITETLKSATKSRPLFKNECKQIREFSLENGDSYIYRHHQDTHDASCVEIVYQAGVQNPKDNATVSLLLQMMKEPAFNQLRTNEQLGYLVWTMSRTDNGSLGIDVVVQGPKEPDFVAERIEAFLAKFREDLEAMTQSEFDDQREGLITLLMEKPKKMTERFARLWAEIDRKEYDFERKQTQVDILRSMEKKHVIDFFDRKFAANAPERKRIAVFVHGKSDDKEVIRNKREATGDAQSGTEVTSFEQFHHSLGLYGLPRPKLPIPPIGVDPSEPTSNGKSHI